VKLNQRDNDGIESLVHRMRGRKLPPERALAKQFGLSRARVRAILDHLEGKGLISRHQGSGTYALDDGSTLVNTVALLIDEQVKLGNDPFFPAVIERVQRVCQTEGIRCTIERVGGIDDTTIVEDGVVAVGLNARELTARLGKNHVPAVGMFVNSQGAAGGRLSVLELDDYAGGRAAAEHLIALRCDSIHFVGSDDSPAARRRLRGVREVAARTGVPLSVLDSEMNFSSGLSDAAQLPAPKGSTRIGVIAASDWLALGLHTGLVSRGKNLRERYHIASFDGLAVTADPGVQIRSFAAPIDSMAADAVSELRRLAASPVAGGREIMYGFS
jgi:DNA-binding LacI/PurR family transcriptional regulator